MHNVPRPAVFSSSPEGIASSRGASMGLQFSWKVAGHVQTFLSIRYLYLPLHVHVAYFHGKLLGMCKLSSSFITCICISPYMCTWRSLPPGYISLYPDENGEPFVDEQ